jgi:hypothetical protein
LENGKSARDFIAQAGTGWREQSREQARADLLRSAPCLGICDRLIEFITRPIPPGRGAVAVTLP